MALRRRRFVFIAIVLGVCVAFNAIADEPTVAAAAPELAKFTTTYAHDADHKSRAFNVELAAEAIRGKVILPNATFSFNDAVGERTAAFGFTKATVIRDGMMAEGMGGGTCQVASTLYAAALLAGVEVVSRSPHTRPSAYIRMGLDATVAFSTSTQPSIDLKLKNTSATPITIRAHAANGTLDIAFDGAPGTAKPDITVTSEVIERIPFTRIVERDKQLSDDQKAYLKTFGIPGYRIRRSRDIHAADGSILKRDIRVDLYPPTTQVLHVAPAFDESRLSVSSSQPWQPMDEDDVPVTAAPIVVESGATRPVLVQLRPTTQVVMRNTK